MNDSLDLKRIRVIATLMMNKYDLSINDIKRTISNAFFKNLDINKLMSKFGSYEKYLEKYENFSKIYDVIPEFDVFTNEQKYFLDNIKELYNHFQKYYNNNDDNSFTEFITFFKKSDNIERSMYIKRNIYLPLLKINNTDNLQEFHNILKKIFPNFQLYDFPFTSFSKKFKAIFPSNLEDSKNIDINIMLSEYFIINNSNRYFNDEDFNNAILILEIRDDESSYYKSVNKMYESLVTNYNNGTNDFRKMLHIFILVIKAIHIIFGKNFENVVRKNSFIMGIINNDKLSHSNIKTHFKSLNNSIINSIYNTIIKLLVTKGDEVSISKYNKMFEKFFDERKKHRNIIIKHITKHNEKEYKISNIHTFPEENLLSNIIKNNEISLWMKYCVLIIYYGNINGRNVLNKKYKKLMNIFSYHHRYIFNSLNILRQQNNHLFTLIIKIITYDIGISSHSTYVDNSIYNTIIYVLTKGDTQTQQLVAKIFKYSYSYNKYHYILEHMFSISSDEELGRKFKKYIKKYNLPNINLEE